VQVDAPDVPLAAWRLDANEVGHIVAGIVKIMGRPVVDESPDVQRSPLLVGRIVS
jgi:hypothetical protein